MACPLLAGGLFCGNFCVQLVPSNTQVSLRKTERLESPPNKTNGEAQQAIDRANVLKATWTKASLREAIHEYEKAASIFISLSDFSNASHSLANSGDVYFVFSEYDKALERYRNADSLAQKANDWRARANALTKTARVRSILGKNDLAQEQLTQAIELFKRNKAVSEVDENAFGETLCTLADVSYSKGDFVSAREQLSNALEKLRNAPKEEARARLLRAQLFGSVGDVENAVTEINRALELSILANDKIGEAKALTTLGLSFSIKRDMSRAIELSHQAIEILGKAGDRQGEAVALNSLGQVYEGGNQPDLALLQYEHALRLFEEIGSAVGMALATFKLARLNNSIGQAEKALKLLGRSIQVSRAAGQLRVEAIALEEMARIHVTQKHYESAEQQYQKILKFYEVIGDSRGQATSLNAYAELLVQLGQSENALELSKRALPLSEKAGDKGILITTLYNLARLELLAGTPESALSSIRRSLEIIEDLRANVMSPDFRVSYFSGVRKHYEFCIKVLMQLDRMKPGQGFAAEALAVNERGKARLLRDLVQESRSALDQGASRKLLDRERELRSLFRIQALYRMDLIMSKKESAEIESVDTQLAQIRSEYQQIQGQLRDQNLKAHSLEQFTQLKLAQIQNELSTDDTMLLEYALGDERSYLWAVSSNSFHAFELPARKVIEDTAVEVYKSLTAPQGTDDPGSYSETVAAADSRWLEKASSLSQMLLGPVADMIGSRRLVVVTEGTLQNIPLDSLPLPTPDDQQQQTSQDKARRLLIEHNEVVMMPSISTLIAIRGTPQRTTSPDKLLAIIADPVFNTRDERVRKNAARGTDLPFDPNSFARLPYTSQEAVEIAAIAPWGSTFMLKGFDAQREKAMSSEILNHKILHIASHGFLDNNRPELSGIVLSMIDQNGNRTNGLMTLHDINSLDLSAELTVLSACQTALGKDIKGEGILGLTHSFLSAGSNTVVATLWKVDDRATAALMVDFYKSMLDQGSSPSAALRSAKLKLMKEKGWDAPYYWAGFVVQGEYTNKITVARHSWSKAGFIVLLFFTFAVGALIVVRKWRRSTTNSKVNLN